MIAERIGWDRGMTILKDRVRELRPAYVPVDPVSRTVYRPGALAKCDLWFPEADIPLGYGQCGRMPVLVMVSSYSRVITSRMLPSRRTGDLIDGHWWLLTKWGAVPKTLVWDNEAGIGRGRPTSEFAAFAGLLATKIYLPARARTRGAWLLTPARRTACTALRPMSRSPLIGLTRTVLPQGWGAHPRAVRGFMPQGRNDLG
ncbi:hypothetical protein ABZZ20_35970 [Streptomyces sp. NPDC006430]|uniref:hypothetical protein n=1 Tax=Streptomyces sp. NPDC006430 TaxID=3154299 RepID=UPI0033B8C327